MSNLEMNLDDKAQKWQWEYEENKYLAQLARLRENIINSYIDIKSIHQGILDSGYANDCLNYKENRDDIRDILIDIGISKGKTPKIAEIDAYFTLTSLDTYNKYWERK